MSEFDLDLFVIGGGSGGVRAARRAAERGWKVALAEKSRLGGTCVHLGCIPKKIMMQTAMFAQEVVDAAHFGWQPTHGRLSDLRLCWSSMKAARDREVHRLSLMYPRILQRAGVAFFSGHASLIGTRKVSVASADGKEQTFRARNVLIATGSRPFLPPGLELANVSDQVFDLAYCPKKLAIIGGGFIGVEFAGIFRALGASVTLFVRGERLLRGFDAGLANALAQRLTARGVRILYRSSVADIEKRPDGLAVLCTNKESRAQSGPAAFDFVLAATGRRPSTDGLGLEEAGIARTKNAAVWVDEHSRTSRSWAYAIGDVTSRGNLTPTAIAEAEAVVSRLHGEEGRVLTYEGLPMAVFSIPPLASVGFSEEVAVRRCAEVKVCEIQFRTLKDQVSGRDEKCYLKIISAGVHGRILGMHMVGSEAPEIIQSLAIAPSSGLTMADLRKTLAIHPTVAEEFFSWHEPRDALV